MCINSFSAKSRIVGVVLLAGVLPVLVSLAGHWFFGDVQHVQEPIHEGFELAGSCIALGVAMLLLMRLRHENTSAHLLWVVAALVAMGTMDFVHSQLPFGVAFSWTRHVATFVGGAIFALVWLPLPSVVVRWKQQFILMVAMLAMAGSLAIFWWPELLPAAWVAGNYSLLVIAVNALGGMGFIAAALFFIRRYLQEPLTEDLVFASLTLLFGTASLFFGISHVWAADWWVWHGFRLFAYIIVLVAAYQTIVRLYEQLTKYTQELEVRVNERTADLAAANETLRDEIAERRQAEMELLTHRDHLDRLVEQRTAEVRAANTYNRSLIDASIDPLVTIAPDGKITDVNIATETVTGLARRELIGTDFSDYFTDSEKARAGYREAFAKGIIRNYELLLRHADGSNTPVEFNATVYRDESGQVVGVFASARDITEKKRGAELLRGSEERFRMIVEGVKDYAMIMLDTKGNIESWNTGAERIKGYRADEIIGRHFSRFYSKEDIENRKPERELEEASSGGRFEDEGWRLRKDGSRFWASVIITAMRDDAGALRGFTKVTRDITERKMAEEKNKKLTSELGIIIDSIPGLVFYKDAKNRYLRVNKFVADAHKMSKEEMEGIDCFTLYPREQAQAYLDDDLQVINSGKPKLNIDEPWKTSEGVRWVSTSKIPYIDETGKAVGIIGISLDITERKMAEERINRQNWLKIGQAELNEVIRGEKEIGELTDGAVSCVAKYTGAPVGALYLKGGHGNLELVAGYSHDRNWRSEKSVFAIGQGLVGQSAAEKHTLRIRDIPKDSVRLVSGLVKIAPNELLYIPLLLGNEVKGVLEIGAFQPLSEQSVEFLESIAESIAVALNSSELRSRQKSLLEEAQRLTEELRVQQEELRTTNEELEEQTQRLKESEERLKAQQEEMEVTNEELKEKNQLLERQKREVETARRQIQEKAEEVALASKYKSEFLANMSHELRTPLNSLLLLAQSLSENKEGNLTEDQKESARVIHGSGSDLLSLINEVLDLAKIESGRMDLRPGKVPVSELATGVERAFRHVAQGKGLHLEVKVAENTPKDITTDRHRTEQIIRNLVANAIKFTESGEITVTFSTPPAGVDLFRSGLVPGQALAISVKDTGIGIAPEKHKVIFEAFQQADGGTSRKYGGTGLGLSISRELAQLLGGEILLESEQEKGSTFTLYLPTVLAPQPDKSPARNIAGALRGQINQQQAGSAGSKASTPETETARAYKTVLQPGIPDDRDVIGGTDTVILLVEDDPVFAKVLYDTCHERGFKCLAASTGNAGLELAQSYLPSGVVLDIRLPDMDGWSVLGALKEDTRTRHIPVHVISAVEATTESIRKGAIGHVAKPINREQLDIVLGKLQQTAAEKVKRVLLVEDDPEMRRNVKSLIGDGDVKLDEAATGKEAIEAMSNTRYSCLILDLGLPDMDGGELLARLQAENMVVPPVIVHTARDLTEREEMELREHAQSIVIKDVRSQERLLDEVSLFLHRMVSKMPEKKKQMIRNLHETDVLLKDKKVLLVDDDMRTSFAVSRLLSEHGMLPVKAANGQQALKALEDDPAIDFVLMDIMMPIMDGYETMKRIRTQERFRKLPIIALTAKAMPEDRQKCIEAGANDYMPKPLDPERLISMMRVWLYR